MIEDAIEKYIPSKGVFRIYYNYLKEVNVQYCSRYGFFALAGGIGAVIKRKVWIQRGSPKLIPLLFPNPWIVLLGPQGKGNKSSCLRGVKELLLELPPNLQPRFLAAKTTPEALAKSLSSPLITPEVTKGTDPTTISVIRKKAQGLIYSSEFGTLLGKEKYLVGLPIFLTDIYDCPDEWESDTILRGDQRLYDVCISLLAASTPDWMNDILPRNASQIGFLSRLLLVPLPPGWEKRTKPNPDNPELRKKVLEEIVKIAKVEGEMRMTSECSKLYEDWYMNLPSVPPGPKAEYLERKQDHILRLAIILQLSYNYSLEMEAQTFKDAIDIYSSIEEDVLRIIDYISMEPKMRIVQKVLEIVEFEEEIEDAKLLEIVWPQLSRPSEYDEVVRLLLRTKKVVWEEGKFKLRR